MTALKVKPFTGITKIASETIERHEMEQALRDAQFALDVQLHDLRSEFLHREAKLRDDYLAKVTQHALRRIIDQAIAETGLENCATIAADRGHSARRRTITDAARGSKDLAAVVAAIERRELTPSGIGCQTPEWVAARIAWLVSVALRPLAFLVGHKAIRIHDRGAMLTLANIPAEAERLAEREPLLGPEAVLDHRMPEDQHIDPRVLPPSRRVLWHGKRGFRRHSPPRLARGQPPTLR